MSKGVETQPGEIVGEQPKTGFLDKLKVRRLKILSGILGVLVFAGAVFGVYKLGQRQVQPALGPTPTSVVVATPTPLPSEAPAKEGDPTANWKTYTNTTHKYSIKYPGDWSIKEMDPNSWTGGDVSPIEFSTPKFEGFIVIEARPNTYSSLDAWVQSFWVQLDGYVFPYSIGDTTLNGVIAKKLSTDVEGGAIRTGAIKGDSLYIIHVVGGAWETETKRKELERIYDQILSTFRFLE